MQIGQEHNSGPKYTLAPDPEDRNRQFPGIWHNYYPRLSVYLRRVFGIAEQEDIEELVQETLLKVYRNLDRYDSKHALSTWVYRIARNCAIDFLRKKKTRRIRHAGPEAGKLYVQDRPDPVVTDLLKKEERDAVRRALESLAREDRNILFLRYYEELSCREIGRIMKLPEGTVKSRFYRIRGELRILLKEVL